MLLGRLGEFGKPENVCFEKITYVCTLSSLFGFHSSPAHRQGNTKKNDFYKYYTSFTEPFHIEHNKNIF